MAYADVTTTTRSVRQGECKVRLTLAGTVAVGDLIGYKSGWVQAGAKSGVYAEFVAGEAGVSGREITVFRKATVYGITSGTGGSVLFLSDTAGGTSDSAGTVEQRVGIDMGNNSIWLEPSTLALTKDTFMCNQYFGTPALASTTAIHIAITQPDSGTTTVTTAITNPDVCRNLTITGSQATCAGNVVIVGTNYDNIAITETVVLSGTSTVASITAFKTVTSITVPVKVASGDTVAVGSGLLLGLCKCLAAPSQYILTLVDRAVGATGTVAVSATAIESNTVNLSALTYNATKVFVGLLVNA